MGKEYTEKEVTEELWLPGLLARVDQLYDAAIELKAYASTLERIKTKIVGLPKAPDTKQRDKTQGGKDGSS